MGSIKNWVRITGGVFSQNSTLKSVRPALLQELQK